MAHIRGKQASAKRMDKLEKSTLKHIESVLNKKSIDGDFTVNEVVSVLTKLAYQFTSRGLDYQYLEAEPPVEDTENIHKLNPKGKA